MSRRLQILLHNLLFSSGVKEWNFFFLHINIYDWLFHYSTLYYFTWTLTPCVPVVTPTHCSYPCVTGCLYTHCLCLFFSFYPGWKQTDKHFIFISSVYGKRFHRGSSHFTLIGYLFFFLIQIIKEETWTSNLFFTVRQTPRPRLPRVALPWYCSVFVIPAE